MIPKLSIPHQPVPPFAAHRPALVSPRVVATRFARLVREARSRCQPRSLLPGQRQLRPEQVGAGYGLHGMNTSTATAFQAAAHAAAPAGDAAWVGAGAAVALAACLSSPVETIKTVQDVRAGRRKARAARERVDAAMTRLAASRSPGDPVQLARDRLDHRHALESWVATRRCFQGTLPQLRRRQRRWQQELDRLNVPAVISKPAALRRQRLERRLEATRRLGLRRVVQLRSSAVSVEKRLKEGLSAGRNVGSVLGIASTLAAASSPFMAFVATVFLPWLLPVLLWVDGLAGTVEATQLIDRARAGRQQLRAGMQRTARACRALQSAPPASARALFCQGLEALETAHRDQERQCRRELRQGWWRRMRSAAFVVLAPVALGLGMAMLFGAAATPAGWAVAAVLGVVVAGYCIAQAVFNRQQANQARAVIARQQDHVELARRVPDWHSRAQRLAEPLWSGNGYLAVEMMARALIEAAHDPAPADLKSLQAVLRHDLGAGRRLTSQLLTLAAAVPRDAPSHHEDVWRLCEALMRRFGLPVPKAGRRPGAA